MTLSTTSSVAAGNYTIPVVATSGSLSHTFDVSLVVQSAGGVQLADLDIGNPSTPGSLVSNNGTYTVSGSGADIWGALDHFNYAYQTAGGDLTITSHVGSVTNADGCAQSGD